jgi:hypothetical protein
MDRKALNNPICIEYSPFAYTTSGKSDTFGFLSMANTAFIHCLISLGKIFAKSERLSGVVRMSERSGGGMGFDLRDQFL